MDKDRVGQWVMVAAVCAACAAGMGLAAATVIDSLVRTKSVTVEFKDVDIAAWVQAVGSVLAIAAGFAVIHRQHRLSMLTEQLHTLEAERDRAECIVLQSRDLNTILGGIRQVLVDQELNHQTFGTAMGLTLPKRLVETIHQMISDPQRCTEAYKHGVRVAMVGSAIMDTLEKMGKAGIEEARWRDLAVTAVVDIERPHRHHDAMVLAFQKATRDAHSFATHHALPLSQR